MSAPKLCKDCKHVQYVPYLTFLPRWVDKDLAKCEAPQSYKPVSLVDGRKEQSAKWCASQRMYSSNEDYCCKEGRWWEPK